MSTDDTDPRLQWSAEYGPTAKEIDEQRAVLKAAYAESIGKLVDGLADCEHRIAQYEMELAAQGKADAITRYTNAHFQTAARALVAMFMQSDPPNYLKMPVLVDDDLRLIITVKREGAKSPQTLLVEKTTEAEAEISREVERRLAYRVAQLEAQVRSFTERRYSCRPEERPDDTEAHKTMYAAEDLHGALWELGAKYDVNLTNNSERWHEGVFLRHVANFCEDVENIAAQHLQPALAMELAECYEARAEAEARVAELEGGIRNLLKDHDHDGGCPDPCATKWLREGLETLAAGGAK